MLDHPNIVKFYGYIKTPDYMHFVMEYVEEGSLFPLAPPPPKIQKPNWFFFIRSAFGCHQRFWNLPRKCVGHLHQECSARTLLSPFTGSCTQRY